MKRYNFYNLMLQKVKSQGSKIKPSIRNKRGRREGEEEGEEEGEDEEEEDEKWYLLTVFSVGTLVSNNHIKIAKQNYYLKYNYKLNNNKLPTMLNNKLQSFQTQEFVINIVGGLLLSNLLYCILSDHSILLLSCNYKQLVCLPNKQSVTPLKPLNFNGL